MEMCDILWNCSKDHFFKILKNICNEYLNNEKYKVNLTRENQELKGFCVYHEEKDCRFIDEFYYVGNNKYFTPLKMWIWAKKGAKIIRARTFKENKKMLKICEKLKFRIINEDINNYLLEREVS